MVKNAGTHARARAHARTHTHTHTHTRICTWIQAGGWLNERWRPETPARNPGPKPRPETRPETPAQTPVRTRRPKRLQHPKTVQRLTTLTTLTIRSKWSNGGQAPSAPNDAAAHRPDPPVKQQHKRFQPTGRSKSENTCFRRANAAPACRARGRAAGRPGQTPTTMVNPELVKPKMVKPVKHAGNWSNGAPAARGGRSA